MKVQKRINLLLSFGLSLVFIHLIISNPFVSFGTIGGLIGLLAEVFYFVNTLWGKR